MQRTFAILLIFCSVYLTKSEDLFVEEAGETDFIPIESEPDIRSKRTTSDYTYNYNDNYDYDQNSEGKIAQNLYLYKKIKV